MKLLFWVLLLANLCLFAWQYTTPSLTGPVERPDSDVPRLRLYGELDHAERQRLAGGARPEVARPSASSAGLPAAEDAPQVQEPLVADVPDADTEQASVAAAGEQGGAPVCVTLGPFYAPEQAATAAARLRTLGREPERRSSGGQIRAGYWVYLPPYSSRDAAERAAEKLKARGIEDLYIVGGAENRNAVSLGLFSTPERADRRAAQIGKLGFTPQIAERFRDTTLYWLDYREPADGSLQVRELGVLAIDPPPERLVVPCGTDSG